LVRTNQLSRNFSYLICDIALNVTSPSISAEKGRDSDYLVRDIEYGAALGQPDHVVRQLVEFVQAAQNSSQRTLMREDQRKE
jgi:hypothetical protein